MARAYYIVAISAVVALVAGAVTYRSSGKETSFVAADFNEGDLNRLGGKLNVYQRAPSLAEREFVTTHRRGSIGRGLRIHANRASEGFCGVWIHLFDMDASQPKYLDTKDYRCLSFWVKGEEGGEEFILRLADKKWIAKQDSIALGPISDFLPGGVTSEWQEVLVPLHSDDTLDWHHLGGLTFDFDKPGSYTVYVDDVSFKQYAAASAPERVPVRIIQNKPAIEGPEMNIITRPSAGARVSRVEELGGNLAPGQQAVVLVRCAQPKGLWWIQGQVERSGENGIKSRIQFGNDSTPPGTEFHAVVILPPTTEAAREFRVGETLRTLPEGMPKSKVVQVVSR